MAKDSTKPKQGKKWKKLLGLFDHFRFNRGPKTPIQSRNSIFGTLDLSIETKGSNEPIDQGSKVTR